MYSRDIPWEVVCDINIVTGKSGRMWFLDSMKLTVKLTGEVTVEHIPLKLVEYQGLCAVITIDANHCDAGQP